MAVLKRFICSKHGEFDAWAEGSVRCPAAKCRCKPREMVSAPAYHGGRTAGIDKTLNNLASDFKMTDMRSSKEGDSQAGFHHHGQSNDAPPPGSGVLWGNAGAMNLETLIKGGGPKPVRDEKVGIKASDMGVQNRGPNTYLPPGVFAGRKGLLGQ